MKHFYLLLIITLFSTKANAALIFVTDAGDSGPGTLRQAIDDANNNPGADTITFSPLLSGSTISPTTAMLEIVDDSTYIIGDLNLDGEPNIRLDGGSLASPTSQSGLTVLANYVVINGICISNFPGQGILLSGAAHTNITSCYIGTDLAGTTAQGNGTNGVYISGGDSIAIGLNNFGNVISGNGSNGIYVASSGHVTVYGNIVGLDASGTSGIANGSNGVYIINTDSVSVGNSLAGGRNILSNNTLCGILSNNSDYVTVINNYIGTDITGSAGLGNAAAGITTFSGTNYWVIGSTLTAGNVISGNNQYGLDLQGNYHVVSANIVGLDASETSAIANGSGFRVVGSEMVFRYNTISGNLTQGFYLSGSTTNTNLIQFNSIYNNNLGINLVSGAQHDVQPPIISGISSDTTVSGTSAPFALIHLYADADDEGELYLDSVRADISGNWSLKLTESEVNDMNNSSLVNITAIQDSVLNSSAFSGPFTFSIPVTSIENSLEPTVEIKCLPNPVRDVLTVHSSKEMTGELKVSDVLGNTLYEGRFDGIEKLSLKGYPSGLYFVQVSENQKTYTVRVIKD